MVTAVEMMAFGTDDAGVAAFTSSSSLLGDIGTAYIGSWIGEAITLGAAISAFGCCLACVVGASRLVFAFARDTAPAERSASGLAAVNSEGVPARAALATIAEVEGPDLRGPMAGAVGWVDAGGDGEFAVAIRSGVLHGERLRLFAGAGIVAGSRPQDEVRETTAKLATMARAVGL